MKKLPSLFLAIACCVLSFSCLHHDRDLKLSLTDSDHYFSMSAHFSRSKTSDVERYMDRRIGNRTNMSFVNSRIDGTIALDDHTVFYIKKSPGLLKIKLDKDENSDESYHRIRSMCEGIKRVLR